MIDSPSIYRKRSCYCTDKYALVPSSFLCHAVLPPSSAMRCKTVILNVGSILKLNILTKQYTELDFAHHQLNTNWIVFIQFLSYVSILINFRQSYQPQTSITSRGLIKIHQLIR